MESLLWLVVNLEEALSSSLFSDLSSQKVILFYFVVCSKTLHLKSLIISSMFSHFVPIFASFVCFFYLTGLTAWILLSWRCLSTSKSLIRIIMMRLARSKLSFSKTEQNSNRCERAKLRGVWVSLDPNTPLTISLCSINWTGYGVAPTNGRLSVYKWKADWGQDSLAFMCCTYLILQVPHSIPVSEFLKCCATFWKNAAFKATHVKQQIWIVFTVNRHKTFIPVECCHRSW